jgi:hypothetical protein
MKRPHNKIGETKVIKEVSPKVSLWAYDKLTPELEKKGYISIKGELLS